MTDYKKTTIRVPKELWKRVEHASTEADISLQEYVIKALESVTPKFIVKRGKR